MSEIFKSEWFRHTAEAEEKSLLQREPVLLKDFLTGPIVGLITWLGAGDPGHVGAQVAGAVVTVLVVLTGWVLRQYVSPAWKSLTGDELASEVTEEQDTEPEPEPDTADYPAKHRPRPS